MPTRRLATALLALALLALPTASSAQQEDPAHEEEAAAVATTTAVEATAPAQPEVEPVTLPQPDLEIDIPAELAERLHGYSPPVWRLPPDTIPSADGDDAMQACEEAGIEPQRCRRVAGRRITADGIVILDCADGSTWRTNTRGEDVYTTSGGRSCRDVLMRPMSTSVPPALPPTEPPRGASAASWAEEVNRWLEAEVAQHLLERIRTLLSPRHFATYRELEEKNTHNLYQRVDHRLSFLTKLLGDF